MEDFSALSYDKTTGTFTWRVCRKKINPGMLAGSKHNKGYWRIKIGGNTYLAHRLVWFFEHGEFPEHFIDHINGNKMDNRISNLRKADFALNAQNKRAPYKNNKSGYMGVRLKPDGRQWNSSIRSKGKNHFLGSFDDPEKAHAAHLNAKRRLHEGCTI